MDDSSPPRSPDANPTKNMHKLAAILGIVSIFWITLLSFMKYKPNTGPIPSWFHVYNTLSLVGWATWVVYYTMIDSKREKNPTPNKPHEAWNLLHIVPIALLNVTVYKSLSVKNKAQLWFFALMVFRYYRTVVTRFFYFRYKVAKPISGGSKFNSKDCTVIVPTVGPGEDSTRFANMATAILLNKPARLIFSANNKKAEKDIKEVMKELQVTLAKNIDNPIRISLQRDKDEPKDVGPMDLDPTEVDTRVGWTYVNHSNKRKQTCQAIGKVNQEGKNRVMTEVIILVDDTAIWHKNLLEATLPAFNDPEVGLVGTHKSVVYQRLETRPPQPGDDEPATPAFDTAQTQEYFPEQEILQPKKGRRPEDMGWLEYCVQWYWAGMWNTMGALYLMRHSYETEASNTADGGVFAVSGRTMLVLAEIVQDTKFKEEFLEEYVGGSVFTWLAWLTSWHVPLMGYLLAGFKSIGLTEKGVGPLLADDDNFITRWVIDHGHSIKIQSSPEATMSTANAGVARRFDKTQ
ncbi:hypothetical protein J4E85_001817 [Alternaria conjuncta]|uniref:uncharacterized protein n=1 Tax=Alternaria conjuncta TaxID=181017 RepID=UPI0022205A6D|nr:uncharacterized protein J4E85_001817 [Alternaria conjuncta]KAI4936487.1 hypothetical protein J4E85_001817 [Alternaria conjuncta]